MDEFVRINVLSSEGLKTVTLKIERCIRCGSVLIFNEKDACKRCLDEIAEKLGNTYDDETE